MLREFKSGARLGYTPAMTEVMSGVEREALPAIAHYLAHRPTSR